MARDRIQERVDELIDDDDTWNEFVEKWMKENPDAVFEKISDMLDYEISENPGGTTELDWLDFLWEKAESEYQDYLDQRAEEIREMEYLEKQQNPRGG